MVVAELEPLGSSPHTRGARQAILHVSSLARIIPAYAGSTDTLGFAAGPKQDHPRIRGEHELASSVWAFRAGSSPHTRGARQPLEATPLRDGIIPAYAGSTIVVPHFRAALGDHPRIRGEHGTLRLL